MSDPNPRTIPLPAKVTVTLRAGAILALANIVCVVIFSLAWMHVRGESKSISVTGSAKQAITSDLIVWKATVTATEPDLPAAYDHLNKEIIQTLEFLKTEGVPAGQMTISPIYTEKHFVRDEKGNVTDKISGYELKQNVEISSSDVLHVASVGRKITGLIQNGVMVESAAPQFFYTKLADMKITMLAEATKDAANRAQQIAGNSGAALGPVIDARMGVMQINPIHDNNVSDSGNNDTSSYEKEITAVVTARFSIK